MIAVPPELQTNEGRPVRVHIDGEIADWRISVSCRSRQPHILLWTAMAIIGVGILLGHLLEPVNKKDVFAGLIERATLNLHGELGELSGQIDLSTEILKPKPDLGCGLRSLASCLSADQRLPARRVRT